MWMWEGCKAVARQHGDVLTGTSLIRLFPNRSLVSFVS